LLLSCQYRQTRGDHQIPFVEHTAVRFPRADEGGTSEVSARQQLFQCRQCPGLAWTLLAVHLLKKGKIRAKPDDLWSHQLDPFAQRRPHSLAWLVEVFKVESRHTKLRHVITAAFRDE
jgi:hypothetical protein